MQDTDLDAAHVLLSGMADWARLAGGGVAQASFAGFDAAGRFLVTLADGRTPVPALSTVGLAPADAGCRVVVAFEGSDPARPVIVGRLQAAPAQEPVPPVHCTVDGERVSIEAQHRIELRCGEASIVLTRAGKVLIKGNFVLTRSRGANKIKGAYVDIN
ncbi:DUF6484 domain-containing protein [Xenophilus azovorans]|uniref:DUF6484 domain-containing protein n=1 Tax=Xenophilus azovorans TaxID=151755 RepID=UPI00056EF1E0|nr:DUF6484 domain-containing protein [Xenophilus azovorans]